MSDPPAALLLATANAHKVAEFRRLLPPGLALLTLADRPLTLPPELGTTFAENARQKALAAASAVGLLALADDSGLEVDALGGQPGIFSARFAGEGASDAQNREKLLSAMRDVLPERRTARFRCVVALARPGHVIGQAEGACEGTVAAVPVGRQGFGYDPVFRLPCGRTMAELSPLEKDRISHRGRACLALLPTLAEAIAAWTGSEPGR